jgi:hypothetical protein
MLRNVLWYVERVHAGQYYARGCAVISESDYYTYLLTYLLTELIPS